MDFDALVSEIVAKVSEKVAAAENGAAAAPAPAAQSGVGMGGQSCGGTPLADNDKPKLLILTQEHGVACHQMLESVKLAERYQTVCALMNHYDCNLSRVEGVILYQLTVDAVAKITAGSCDTAYTKLASQAFLLGKKVYVPCDQVELLGYESTAAPAYYSALREKLALLEKSGLVICPQEALEDTILGGAACSCNTAAASAPAKQEKDARFTKRVLSEKDVVAAHGEGVTRLYVSPRTILTDLAKEYADRREIQLVRE